MLGIILNSTSNIISIPVVHFERKYGQSGYNLKKLIGLWTNYLGFSITPLRLATYTGYFLSLVSVFGGIIVLIKKLLNPEMSAGWPSLMIVILLSLGIELVFLGIIGEYVGRAYMKLNSVPQYIVKEHIERKEK